jgi:hypothetical protein
MEELPFVLAHPAIERAAEISGALQTVTFASGPRGATSEFREELTISVHPDGVLVYAHAWGLPGGEFGERSSSELRRREA